MQVSEIKEALHNICNTEGLSIDSKILIKVEDIVKINNYIELLEVQLEEGFVEITDLRNANKFIYDTFNKTKCPEYNELGEYC
jgi:hypothetical protein